MAEQQSDRRLVYSDGSPVPASHLGWRFWTKHLIVGAFSSAVGLAAVSLVAKSYFEFKLQQALEATKADITRELRMESLRIEASKAVELSLAQLKQAVAEVRTDLLHPETLTEKDFINKMEVMHERAIDFQTVVAAHASRISPAIFEASAQYIDALNALKGAIKYVVEAKGQDADPLIDRLNRSLKQVSEARKTLDAAILNFSGGRLD